MVTGAQGTLGAVHERDTDIAGLVWTSFYLDEANTSSQQCNGDTSNAYGQSGPQAMGALPNTDPSVDAASTLGATRRHYYIGPNAQVAEAERLNHQGRTPLQAKLTKLTP